MLLDLQAKYDPHLLFLTLIKREREERERERETKERGTSEQIIYFKH